MKECPICRQVFADENLRFCRYDGTPLVSKTLRADEAMTIRLKRTPKQPQKSR